MNVRGPGSDGSESVRTQRGAVDQRHLSGGTGATEVAPGQASVEGARARGNAPGLFPGRHLLRPRWPRREHAGGRRRRAHSPGLLSARDFGARRGALIVIVAAVFGLAALSLLRPSAPTTDPWGWIVWGREILHGQLDTDSVLSPAWKPLPVLVTTPLALLGGAAPAAWLVVARAAGLAALLLAYLLGHRLAGRLAGAVAVVTLALSGGWLRGLEHGYSEPLMTLLLLGAAHRHLDGRRLHALALIVLVGLGRPEIWPLAGLYAIVAWRAEPSRRRAVGALIAAIPLLWFVPDWIGSGDPFHGREVAQGASDDRNALDLLGSTVSLITIPVLALAAVGWTVALRARSREAVLGTVAVAWIAFVVVLVLLGYPASERFVALPAALVCVTAGVGAARLADGAGRPASRRAIGVLALVAAAVAYLPARLGELPDQVRAAERRASIQADLRALARTPSLHDHVRCRPAALLDQLTWNAGALAWELHLPLRSTQALASPPSPDPNPELMGPRRRVLATEDDPQLAFLPRWRYGAEVRGLTRPRSAEVVGRARNWIAVATCPRGEPVRSSRASRWPPGRSPAGRARLGRR